MTQFANTDTGRRLVAAILALHDRAEPGEIEHLQFLRFLAKRTLRGEDVTEAIMPVLEDLGRRWGTPQYKD